MVFPAVRRLAVCIAIVGGSSAFDDAFASVTFDIPGVKPEKRRSKRASFRRQASDTLRITGGDGDTSPALLIADGPSVSHTPTHLTVVPDVVHHQQQPQQQETTTALQKVSVALTEASAELAEVQRSLEYFRKEQERLGDDFSDDAYMEEKEQEEAVLEAKVAALFEEKMTLMAALPMEDKKREMEIEKLVKEMTELQDEQRAAKREMELLRETVETELDKMKARGENVQEDEMEELLPETYAQYRQLTEKCQQNAQHLEEITHTLEELYRQRLQPQRPQPQPQPQEQIGTKRAEVGRLMETQRLTARQLLRAVEESQKLHSEVMDMFEQLLVGSLDQLEGLGSGAEEERPQMPRRPGARRGLRGEAIESEEDEECEEADAKAMEHKVGASRGGTELTRYGQVVQCCFFSLPCVFQCLAPLIPRGEQLVAVVGAVASEGGRGLALAELKVAMEKLRILISQAHFQYSTLTTSEEKKNFKKVLDENVVKPLTVVITQMTRQAATNGQMQLEMLQTLLEFERLVELKDTLLVLVQSREMISNRTWNEVHNQAVATIDRTISLVDIVQQQSPSSCCGKTCASCCTCCGYLAITQQVSHWSAVDAAEDAGENDNPIQTQHMGDRD